MAMEFTTQANRLPLKLRLLKAAVATVSRIAPSLVAGYGFNLFITPRPRPITPQQREFLATGERFSVPHKGQDLVAYRWGEGKTVLLVHGWQAHAATMQHFVKPLVEAGYRVVAMDAPAHGDSSGKRLDLLQYGEAIISAINTLGGVHALVAHSIGATSVATMLGTHKHYRINKTVLIAPIDKMTNMLDRYAAGFGLTDRVQKAMANIFVRRFGHPPQYYSNPDLLEDYQNSMLIVHDKQDKLVPYEAGVAIASKVKSSRLLTTEGLGHRRVLAHAGTIQEIVDFVSEEAS